MTSKQIFSYTNHSRMGEPEIFTEGKDDILFSNSSKFYDLTSGLWNVNYGYNSIRFKEIFETQVNSIQYYPNHFWSSTTTTEEAANRLCERFNMHGVYFGTGGSDAVRTAIYISKFVTGKTEVLSHSNGYHGSDPVTKSCTDLVKSVSESTSAIIIEPIMTTAGVIQFPEEVLLELGLLRQKYKFLIIFDETVTGLGRTDINSLISPDIRIISKGLTNGLFPLSATMVNQDVMNYIQQTNKVFEYGITMSGHPIGCALLLKSLELYDAFQQKRNQLEAKVISKLGSITYRNFGLLFGIDVNDGDSVRRTLKRNGFIIRNSQNTIIFAPMFIANPDDYQMFFDILQSNV